MNENNLENQINTKNYFSSLKEENDDIIIEKMKITNKISKNEDNTINNSIKYKISYDSLLKYIEKRKNQNIDQNEFFCNLLLMPHTINVLNRLSTYSSLSEIYIKLNQRDLILRLNRKVEKLIKNGHNFNKRKRMILLYKTAYILWEENRNLFYAVDYIKKSCNIMNEDSKGEIEDSEKFQASNNMSIISNSTMNYIDEKKSLFKEDSIIEKAKKLIELIESILTENNNKDIDENDENKKYLYVISRDWLVNLVSFIKPFTANLTEQNNDRDKLIEQSFSFEYILENFEKERNSTKNYNTFPGQIDNFKITSLKDSWKDNENLDENDYIRKKADYLLINYDDWTYIDNIFGHTNILRRKKNNLDLTSFKFILFDKRINTREKNIYLLKERFIQINKNIKIKALKEKIFRCTDNELKPENIEKQICFFILDREKSDILIEIAFGFILDIKMYESIYIKKIELQDEDNLDEFFSLFNKDKHILLVEITQKNSFNYLIQLSKDKCTICERKLDENEINKCDICHYSLFCSKACANRNTNHTFIDKKLNKIMEAKFMLKDMLTDKYNYLLSNGKKGRAQITSREDEDCSFLSSSIHCLSNTLALTKYFVTNSYLKDLKGEKESTFPEYYYKLINALWLSDSRSNIININIQSFCKLIDITNITNIDASDFLFSVLEKLHKNLDRSSKNKLEEIEPQKEDESDEETSKRFIAYDNKLSNSIITDLIRGQCKQKTRCSSCGNEYITFPNFIILKLPISKEKLNIQIKLLTNNLKLHYINININEKTEMKDILYKAIEYLDKKNYINFLLNNPTKEGIFNYNITNVPDNLLYNNLKFIEINKEFKMIFLYNTSYNNCPVDKYNQRNLLYNGCSNNNNTNKFDIYRYKEYSERNMPCELVIFEKDINSKKPDFIPVYVYLISDIETENIIFGTKKIQKIISYPVILAINQNYSLNDLHNLIFKKIKKALISNFQQPNAIDIYYPHFDGSWEVFKMKDGKCPMCQKKCSNSFSCNLFESIDKSCTVSSFMEKQGKDRPVILFAKSDVYNERGCIYEGMELYFGKNNEIEAKEIITLYDSFESFNSHEKADETDKLLCKNCNKRTECVIQKTLYKMPFYLIIQLDRHVNQVKNDKYVEYKEMIDLKDYILGPDKSNSIYDLYSVLLHKKFLNNSNYFNYSKSLGTWLSFDKEGIEYIQNPINKDAYILFYKRRKIE